MGWYSNRNKEPFIGPQFALADGSRIEDNYVFGEVGYKKTFEENLTIKPRFYYDQTDGDNFAKAFPDGTTLPLDINGDGTPDIFNTYPDGFIGDGKVSEKMVGTEIPFDYKLFL